VSIGYPLARRIGDDCRDVIRRLEAPRRPRCDGRHGMVDWEIEQCSFEPMKTHDQPFAVLFLALIKCSF
jgi:hypothetical protein